MADLTSLVNSATTAVNAAKSLTSSSLASGITGIITSITNAVTSVGSLFTTIPNVKLPLGNPLHNYATYNYVIGLGCLTDQEINNPDTTYKAGKAIRLICKDANADPNNRVATPYGKFDFFIDNVELKSVVGLDGGNTTNVSNISFTVTEPYSMGMFLIACQTVAQQLGHDNYTEAPYVLTIEFRGNTQTGSMVNVPGSTRHIPFNFNDVSMKVTGEGSVYTCTAQPFNQGAITDDKALFTSDVSITGDTVQSILQTGEKSLQKVINQKLKDTAKAAGITTPDEVIILFPQDFASAASISADSSESTFGATTTSSVGSATAVYQKLGVAESSLNSTQVQQASDCNAIGQASLGFNDARTAMAPVGKENRIWDTDKQIFVRGKNIADPTVTDMKFSQDTDIPNAINQVIINSNYASEALVASNLTAEGYRGWWRIDPQVYNIGPVEKATGAKPKLMVYRVLPYNVHTSNMMPPNLKAPGLGQGGALEKQAVKEYNYIYTGKNVDIINFDITMNQSFRALMGADALEKSQDAKMLAQTSDSADPVAVGNPLPLGALPSTQPGSTPTKVSYSGTSLNTDKKGGGGIETPGIRASRIFMDAVTNGQDLVNLTLTILGDPYFIPNSGMGNYTSAATQYTNLNLDGSMNYQNGEVDIKVNFRTPLDINQTTGLYDFGSKSAPVTQYSGLYRISEVTSKFSKGQFQQTLIGQRRNNYENLFEATPDQTFNTSSAKVDNNDPENVREE
jgi:hypothetical protein